MGEDTEVAGTLECSGFKALTSMLVLAVSQLGVQSRVHTHRAHVYDTS